jgi:hypothetical protein
MNDDDEDAAAIRRLRAQVIAAALQRYAPASNDDCCAPDSGNVDARKAAPAPCLKIATSFHEAEDKATDPDSGG